MRRRKQYSRADVAPLAFTRRRTDDRRGSASSRGYSSRWRAYRTRFLTEFPVCIHCQTVTAIIIDHIIPVLQDGSELAGSADELFWPSWNHQPLCRACHRVKTDQHDQRLTLNRRSILTRLETPESDENARRNELLRRAEVWVKWIDLETGAEVMAATG